MKKIFRILMIIILFACVNAGCGDDISEDVPCGFHNGNQLYKGPKGGCYYINSNNNKTYVDRSECDC